MAKNPKMKICRNCDAEIAAKAKKCPACGARQKASFYKRGWFIFLIIIVVFGLARSIVNKNSQKTREEEEKANEYRWPGSELAAMIPKPESRYGRIVSEGENSFYINIYQISKDQFEDYIEKCRESGFTVDYSRHDDSYWADDEEGYSLGLMFDEDGDELAISLNAPETEKADGTPGEEKGSGQKADRQESEPPAGEEESEPDGNGQSVPEAGDSEQAESGSGDGMIDGMRPEFKEAMDSYEAFYDEYCEFMQQYTENPSDLDLLAKYTELMSKASEMEERFDAWEGDMNDTELKYYTEVSLRISQKLLETGTEMQQ